MALEQILNGDSGAIAASKILNNDKQTAALKWTATDAGATYPTVRRHEGKLYGIIEGQTATATAPSAAPTVWELLGGSGIPEEIDRDFNETYFPNPGLYEDVNEAAYYKNTGRIKISEGTIVTAHISGDDAWAPKVAGIIVIKDNVVIQRIFTGNPGAWVNLTYIATDDVEIVINHRIAAFTSGYYYHLFYKPVYGMKDLNVAGGVLGYDLYKNAVYSTNAYTIEDNYVWKVGQVLLNGTIENTSGIERRTDYLPVVQGQVITLDSRMGTNANVISFYNSAGAFVGGIPGNDIANTYKFTAPQNGYVIICTYVVAGFVGNFKGVDVPLTLKKIVAENNIDAPAGIASIITGASKKAFTIPQAYPTNGLLSIIDDDGNANVISYLLPLLQSKGLPVGLAIAAKLIIDGNFDGRPSMTEAQLIGLKDNALVEIMNHTYSHAALGAPTKYHAYNELKKNHDWLLERGIISESFVSPYGSYNLTTIEMINKLYDSHYSTYPDTNSIINMKNLEIGRINFGSDGVSLANIKNLINDAKANNKYIVIMTHVGGYNDYANWRADFENLVDFIVASGITVVKPTDAFNKYKNMFERYGDFKISADGLKRKY